MSNRVEFRPKNINNDRKKPYNAQGYNSHKMQ